MSGCGRKARLTMIRVGSVLRVWRAGSGLSLDRAAQEIGIPRSILHRIEQGEDQRQDRGQLKHKAKSPRRASNGMDGQSLSRIVIWLLGEEKVK